MQRFRIGDRLSYLVPSSGAVSSFIGCAGLLVEDLKTGIIDGNLGDPDTEALLASTTPDDCIISHYHVDHSRWGHLAARREETVVHVPESEKRYLTDVDHFVERSGLPNGLGVLWRKWLTEQAGFRPIPTARVLSGGDVLDFGRTRIEIVDASGHSPGHQAYWLARERILHCVDLGVDAFGPWYGWKDADLVAYIDSVHRLASLGARLLVTSHGGLVDRDIEDAILGCIDVMRRREVLVRRDLEAGLTVDECAARGHVYGDPSRFSPPLDRMYAIWERCMVAEHARVLDRGGIDAIDAGS